MNYNSFVASQLIAERQAALAGEAAHRSLVGQARAARRASAVSARWPARTRRLFSGRPAPAGA
jgi:hypothetical protein